MIQREEREAHTSAGNLLTVLDPMKSTAPAILGQATFNGDSVLLRTC